MLMQRTSLILVLLLALTILVGAEDEGQLFGGGGGPMPSLLFLNLDDLNGAITNAGYPQLNQVLFAMGGGGYGGALDGIRIGGFGLGGDSLSVSGTRTVSFDLGFGGMMLEKAAHRVDGFTVVLGSMFGFGGLDLRFVSDLPTTFEDAIESPFVSAMSKEFWAVQPYIAFESQPTSWLWARFQLGFLWTLADKWTFEGAEFAGPPRTLGGLTASLMVRFGGGGKLDLDDMEAAFEELSSELNTLDSDAEEDDAE